MASIPKKSVSFSDEVEVKGKYRKQKSLSTDATNSKNVSYVCQSIIFSGFLSILFVLLYLPTQNHVELPLQHYHSISDDMAPDTGVEIRSSTGGKTESYIDRWWASGKDYRKFASFKGEINSFCEAEVKINPEEFKYEGNATTEGRRKFVFVVHHKTGTHLLRTIENELLRLAGMNEQPLGGCYGRNLPRWTSWARRLEFWCKWVGNRYPFSIHGNRMVHLARHPRNMLISQHVYQKALQDARLKFKDTVKDKDNKFYKGLKKNNTLMAWEGTLEIMSGFINDMIKHMRNTVGDSEVLTVEMENHFYTDFDGTVKRIFFHLLQDRISPLDYCKLRLQASFQDTKRFGSAVDDSHKNTHIASDDKKAQATSELDFILLASDQKSANFRNTYNDWVASYENLTQALWTF